jgi:hypothetical protein
MNLQDNYMHKFFLQLLIFYFNHSGYNQTNFNDKFDKNTFLDNFRNLDLNESFHDKSSIYHILFGLSLYQIINFC